MYVNDGITCNNLLRKKWLKVVSHCYSHCWLNPRESPSIPFKFPRKSLKVLERKRDFRGTSMIIPKVPWIHMVWKILGFPWNIHDNPNVRYVRFLGFIEKTIQIQNSLENPKFPLTNIHWSKTSIEKKDPNSLEIPSDWISVRGWQQVEEALRTLRCHGSRHLKAQLSPDPKTAKAAEKIRSLSLFFWKDTEWIHWLIGLMFGFFLEETVLEDLLFGCFSWISVNDFKLMSWVSAAATSTGRFFLITHSRDQRSDAPQKTDMGGVHKMEPPNGWYGWFISWMVPIDWLLNWWSMMMLNSG